MKLTVKTMNEDPAGYQCWISINSDAVVFGLLVFLVTKPGTISLQTTWLGGHEVSVSF